MMKTEAQTPPPQNPRDTQSQGVELGHWVSPSSKHSSTPPKLVAIGDLTAEHRFMLSRVYSKSKIPG